MFVVIDKKAVNMRNACFAKIEKTLGGYKLDFKFGYRSIEYVPSDDAIKALKIVGQERHSLVAVKLLKWLSGGDEIITTEDIDKKIIEICGEVM